MKSNFILPRKNSQCGSTGMIQLDKFRFFTRGLMSFVKFQGGLLLLVFGFSLYLTFNVQAGEPVLGKPAPGFTLMGADGKGHSLSDYKGSFIVLEWFNPDCPFVKKHYNSKNMQKLQKYYREKGVIWMIVNSSAKGKQGYCTTERANEVIKDNDMVPTAFLLDHDGKVGRLYGAKTTPHMYVIDKDGLLIYHGAIDNKPSTRIKDIKDAENYVRAALDEAIAGKSVSVKASQPYGCSVKYAY
ncbi:MAG: thioredoxin family protein [Candidatus Scalinduaceae bacterium]